MRIALLLGLILFGCTPAEPPATPSVRSPPERATSSTLTPTLTPSSTRTGVAPQRADTKRLYRLVVSFGSECCGTDQVAYKKLETILGRYPPQALGHETGSWGKEGESDDCFTLDGLSPAERTRFVNEVRGEVRGKLVSVEANAACRNDRP